MLVTRIHTASGLKVVIPESELRCLYQEQMLSVTDIAFMAKCSKPTILKLLREYSIQVRTGSDAHRTPKYNSKFDNRLDIPKSAFDGYVDGDNVILRDIAHKYNCSYSGIRKVALKC